MWQYISGFHVSHDVTQVLPNHHWFLECSPDLTVGDLFGWPGSYISVWSFVLFFIFLRLGLYSPKWPQILYVAKAGLELFWSFCLCLSISGIVGKYHLTGLTLFVFWGYPFQILTLEESEVDCDVRIVDCLALLPWVGFALVFQLLVMLGARVHEPIYWGPVLENSFLLNLF